MKLVTDTLVSNFYNCFLQNPVGPSWSVSKESLFPGNMQGHVYESPLLGKEEQPFQGVPPRVITVLLAHSLLVRKESD